MEAAVLSHIRPLYMSPFQKKEMTGSAEVTTNLINVCFAPCNDTNGPVLVLIRWLLFGQST